jgi:hypothetical protein
MPKELKKIERKETLVVNTNTNTKMNTLRTKQNSKILKDKDKDKIKNATMNLKINLNMVAKAGNDNRGMNLMTPKTRKNPMIGNGIGGTLRKEKTAAVNSTNTKQSFKKEINSRKIFKEETVITSVPNLFTEENRGEPENKINNNKTKFNTDKKSSKVTHSVNPSSSNTERKSSFHYITTLNMKMNKTITSLNKSKPKAPSLEKKKTLTPVATMNKSNSNSQLISQNYTNLNSFNSNSKKSLLNKDNKLYKYTERIIKELEESKIKEDNYADNDPELDIENEEYTGIRKVEFSELAEFKTCRAKPFQAAKTSNNFHSPDTPKMSVNKGTQSHANMKVLYNTFHGKFSEKKNLNASPIANKTRINLTKKITEKNTLIRPNSEVKRKEINSNLIFANTNSNKNIIVKKTKLSDMEKTRPKSSFKKDLDSKLNEGSLSTEASNIFRGRFEDYAVGKELGKGAYAVVKQALHKPSNRKVAIKIYEKVKLIDTQRKNSVKREIQIMKKLDHNNICKLHEVIDNPKYVCNKNMKSFLTFFFFLEIILK